MQALLVKPGHAPEVITLDSNGEKAFVKIRDLVGGYLERVRIEGLDVYCDEDGNMKRLPPNRHGLVGTFVVLGPGPMWMVGLNETELLRAMDLFQL